MAAPDGPTSCAAAKRDALAGASHLLREIIDMGRASGEFAVGDVDVATDFAVHGLHGALVNALHDDQPDRRRFVTNATLLVKRSLTKR